MRVGKIIQYYIVFSYSIFCFSWKYSTLLLQNGLQMQFCADFKALLYVATVNSLHLAWWNIFLAWNWSFIVFHHIDVATVKKAIRFYNGVHIVLFPSLLRYQLNTMVVDTEAGPHRNRTVVFLGSTRGTVLKFLITPSPESPYSNTNTFLEELEGYNPERWKDFVFETSLRQDPCISDTGQFWEFGVFCVFCQNSGKKTSRIYI